MSYKWVVGSFVVAGGAVALATLNRRVGDAVADAAGKASAVVGATRGFRNNNPGNIREGAGDRTAWQGERTTDDDGAFEEFASPEAGFRALVVILDRYRTAYRLNTPSAIIGRYAPATENDTGKYAAFVAERLGTTPGRFVNTADNGTMLLLVDAITRYENGSNPYSTETMQRGIDAARNRAVVV